MFQSVVDYYLNTSGGNDGLNRQNINGIVLASVLDSTGDFKLNQTNPLTYSDDSKSPNQRFSFYSSNNSTAFDWNPQGKSYIFEDFPIPFYVLTDPSDAVKPFDDCYDKFNKIIFERADTLKGFKFLSTDLLCGMQLGLAMSGAVSSTICTRRSTIQHTLDSNLFCDPLGGSNYFTFLSQRPANSLPITIISSRIDTFTLFEYYTPGAIEPISSIIGLLSLADQLAKYRNDFKQTNILFVLFDNEAFEFGGSSRFVNDLVLNKFPEFNINNSNKTDGTDVFKLDKSNITTMIELSQLGAINLNNQNKLYMHVDPLTYTSLKPNTRQLVDDFRRILNNISNDSISYVQNVSQQLPPSSIQSFLRLNLTIGGVLISDSETIYKNNYFHSIFDTTENLNLNFPINVTEPEAANFTTNLGERLGKLLTNLAQGVYSTYSDNKTILNDTIDQTNLNRLIYCFYKNITCDYFRSILTSSQWNVYLKIISSTSPQSRLSFYTSVNDGQISGKWLTQTLLKYFTRNSLFESLNSTECTSGSQSVMKLIKENNLSLRNIYYLNSKKICVATVVYSVSSVSPSFDKYDQGILVDTDKFSAWTESSWTGETTQMKMFLFTCDAIRVSTILIGVITFILSIFVTFVINKYSDKLFSLNGNSEQVAEFLEQ